MVIIVMGVSGSGKTHIGQLLAEELQWPFFDADNFHTQHSVDKMERGIPLTDEDRQPWLAILSNQIQQWNQERNAVLACSALKESYRERLSQHYTADVRFAYLKGSKELILSRMQDREHFFPPHLLDSQFADLEEPECAIIVNIDQPPEVIVEEIVQSIKSE